MVLGAKQTRPRLLVVRGSFATLGGAERDLLQLVRTAHERWDVTIATLTWTPEAEALLAPASPTVHRPAQPMVWPEGGWAEVSAKGSREAAKGWASLDLPWTEFDAVHLTVGRGTLEILPLIPHHLPVLYSCHEPPRWLYEDVLHRHPDGRPKRPLWLTNLVFRRQRRLDQRLVKALLNRPNSTVFGNSPWSQRLLERTYGLRSPTGTANGEVPKRDAQGRQAEATHVLPTVDLSNWPADASAEEATLDPRLLPERPYVITVGAVSYVKGTWDTLRSLAGTPYALVQAGGGTDEAKRALVAEGERLSVEVRCLTRLSQAHLVSAVRSAHAVVSHAREEPFGLTPLEAMAVGVPPLMVDEGGFHFTMQAAGAGRLVDRRDAEGWRAAYTAASDADLRRQWAEAGRHHVATNYPPEAQIEAVERLLHDLLQAQSS